MISVDAAKSIILDKTSTFTRTCRVGDAVGLVLAASVLAPLDLPLFDNSAMDGYVFRFADFVAGEDLELVGEVAAGDGLFLLPQGRVAMRIFTGAIIPEGADTVIQQEWVSVENGKLRINNADFALGKNIRPQGSEVLKGEPLLEAGLRLSPAAIGLLAAAGIQEVLVYTPPKVAILVTGRELCQEGMPLALGQIYESNSSMLTAALSSIGISVQSVWFVEDTLEDTVLQLEKALADADLVLLSGGISVGDYDFVREATRACGVKEEFYKIRQKPGKPLFFGTKEGKYVFALPGNPGSALTCFYQYVLLFLSKAMMLPKLYPTFKVRFEGVYEKGTGLAHFLKGQYDGAKVINLGALASYKLISFAVANCLIFVPEDVSAIQQEDWVEILVID